MGTLEDLEEGKVQCYVTRVKTLRGVVRKIRRELFPPKRTISRLEAAAVLLCQDVLRSTVMLCLEDNMNCQCRSHIGRV